MPRHFFCLALVALLTASGCYKYVPLGTAERLPGARVRVALSDRGTSDLARYLGPSVAKVEGNIVSSSDGEMVLAVVSTQSHNGIENYWSGEQVAVPRDLITTLQERRFSALRTTLFVGGVVGGAVLLNASLGDVLGLGIRGGKDGGGGGTQ